MQRDLIVKTLEDLEIVVEDETKDKLIDKLFEAYEESVGGLRAKNEEVFDKYNQFRDKLSETQEEKKLLEEKFKAYEKIEDPQEALDAIEKLKSGEQAIDVDAAVERRTKSLREEIDLVKTAKDKEIRDITLANDTLNQQLIQQRFNFEVRDVANKLGVEDRAVKHFAHSMSEVFHWDEEEKNFVARENGEPIYDKDDPAKPADFYSYGKILEKNEPYLFANNMNPALKGNDGNTQTADKYFKIGGGGKIVPTEEGWLLKGSNPKEFSQLEKRYNKTIEKDRRASA